MSRRSSLRETAAVLGRFCRAYGKTTDAIPIDAPGSSAMTLALPPMLSPQLAAPATIKTVPAHARTITIGAIRVHIYGYSSISYDAVRAAVSDAATPTEVVEVLSRLAYFKISPATRIWYVMQNQNLYVICVPLKIDQISGDAQLLPYFKNLTGRQAPPIEDFERDRVLADLLTKRAAENGRLELEADGTSTAQLKVTKESAHGHRLKADLNASNVGNRFVGREIIGADLGYGFAGGTATQLALKHALGGGAATGAAGQYDEVLACISQIATSGVYGLSAHAFYYKQDFQPYGTLDGLYYTGEGSYLTPLWATLSERLVFQIKAAYAKRTTTLAQTDARILGESYGTVEPGLAYVSHQRWRKDWTDFDVEAYLAYGSVLGSAEQSFAQRRNFIIPHGVGQWTWSPPRWGTYTVSISGQYSNHPVPEERQLSYGGPGNLTAYLPGTLLGDRGGLAKLVWSRDITDGNPLKVQLRLYGEYARVAAAPGSLLRKTGSVNAAGDLGAGLTFDFYKALSLSVDTAMPVDKRKALSYGRSYFFISGMIHY